MRVYLVIVMVMITLCGCPALADDMPTQLQIDEAQLASDQAANNPTAVVQDLRHIAEDRAADPGEVHQNPGYSTYGTSSGTPTTGSTATSGTGGTQNPTSSSATALSPQQKYDHDRNAAEKANEAYTTGGVQTRLATCTGPRIESCGPTYYTGGEYFKGDAYNYQQYSDDVAARAAYMNAMAKVTADQRALGMPGSN